MKRFSVITAFPKIFNGFLSSSIIGRAITSGLIKVDLLDLRDFAEGKHRQVDDYTYGGGGMVLMAEPLYRAVQAARDVSEKATVIFPSPQGVILSQEVVESLAQEDHLVIACGHYEGVDERFVESCVDLELSIGDYVLTGGELPAMVIIDAVSRQLPGVVGKAESVAEDSFFRGFLDHPHYTRPAEWRGKRVPEVLLSGDHGAVLDWRRRQAADRTIVRRPDLLSRANILPYLSCGFYVTLLSAPDVSLEELERICAVSGAYGAKKVLVVTPLQKPVATGLSMVKRFPSLESAMSWIEKSEKKVPYVVGVAEAPRSGVHWLELKRLVLERDLPLSLVFCADELFTKEASHFDTMMCLDERGGKIPLSCEVSVVLDRLFGSR